MGDFKGSFARWAGIASGIMAGIIVVVLGAAVIWSVFLYIAAKASDESASFFELVIVSLAILIPWGDFVDILSEII